MPELKDVSIGGASSEDPQKQIESVVKQTNEAFRMISNEARTSITKDDSGKQRLLIGYQDSPGFSNGKVGIKLSQVGIDVGAATNDQLIFSTDFNSFKIVQTGTVSQTLTNSSNTVTAGTQTVAIAHNLGYVPSFLVYVTAPATFVDGNILFQLPHTTFNSSPDAGSLFTLFYATADTTNLNIVYKHRSNTDYSPNSPTFSVRYYLTRETAT